MKDNRYIAIIFGLWTLCYIIKIIIYCVASGSVT